MRQREEEWKRQREEMWRRRREDEWRRGRERYDTVLVSPSLSDAVSFNGRLVTNKKIFKLVIELLYTIFARGVRI